MAHLFLILAAIFPSGLYSAGVHVPVAWRGKGGNNNEEQNSKPSSQQKKRLFKVDRVGDQRQAAINEPRCLTQPETGRVQPGNEVQVLRSHASVKVIGIMLCSLNPGTAKGLIVTLMGFRGNWQTLGQYEWDQPHMINVGFLDVTRLDRLSGKCHCSGKLVQIKTFFDILPSASQTEGTKQTGQHRLQNEAS